MNKLIIRSLVVLAVLFVALHILSGKYEAFSFLVVPVFAHCDTMSGPVVQAAQKALETGKVNLILIWVQKKDEDTIKRAFEQTLKVRKLSPEAKEMADMYFFETLVRIHRAGEGASYNGIKPAGTEVDPSIEMADKAVETGSVNEVITKIPAHVSKSIQEKFNKVMEAKKHMNESVEAGREYVESYVIFIHYVEGIHNAVMSKPAHHGSAEGETEHKH